MLYQLSYLAGAAAKARRPASVRGVIRSIVAAGAVVLVVTSASGATEQPPEPLSIALPSASVPKRLAPLGPGAPRWARRLYRRSAQVLVALTDRNGALVAGHRDGWDYVWPRDAAAGAIALDAAGLDREAGRVVAFLTSLDVNDAARFYPDGDRVPGRTAAGDGEGWIAAANRAVGESVHVRGRISTTDRHEPLDWQDRQDYGENVTGDLLGNAIAAGVPADEIKRRFLTFARPRS